MFGSTLGYVGWVSTPWVRIKEISPRINIHYRLTAFLFVFTGQRLCFVTRSGLLFWFMIPLYSIPKSYTTELASSWYTTKTQQAIFTQFNSQHYHTGIPSEYGNRAVTNHFLAYFFFPWLRILFSVLLPDTRETERFKKKRCRCIYKSGVNAIFF